MAVNICRILPQFFLLPLAFCVGCSGPAEPTPGPLLAAEEYLDPKGFFSLTPPEGWEIQEYPDDPRGKVSFRRSKTTDLRILTNGVDYSDISSLEDDLKGIERSSGLQMNLKRFEFNGMPAMERDFVLQGSRILMIDFIVENVSHNLMYSAPMSRFKNELERVRASLATYEPTRREMSEAEVLESYLAKERRLGRLLIDQRRYEDARPHIEAGLAASNLDPALLELKEELSRMSP